MAVTRDTLRLLDGSEASCDAMQPVTKVIGAASIRARAAAIRELEEG